MTILIAQSSASVLHAGRRVDISRGRTTAHPDHPIVAENPGLFAPIKVTFDMPAADEPAQVQDPAPTPEPDAPAAEDAPEQADAPAEPADAAPAEEAPAVTPNAPVEAATARPGARSEAMAPDTKAIREWATAKGLDVPARGPLPAAVVDAYRAEHAEQ